MRPASIPSACWFFLFCQNKTMLIKIFGVITAVMKAVPHIVDAWKRWRYERYQKRVSDSLKKVSGAKSKEELKDAIVDASKKFNGN